MEKSSENSRRVLSQAKEKVLSRGKRGDVDVKIAEYMAWMSIHNTMPANCRHIACGLIDIINVDR